jgi:hypothetical protein
MICAVSDIQIVGCLTCCREENVAENSSGGYGSLSHAIRHSTIIPQHNSISSSSVNFSALLRPHYSSTSNLALQQSQNCGNSQQLNVASSGNAGQLLNVLTPKQLCHEDSAIITAQYGYPEQQQYGCSSSKTQQPLRCVSASSVSVPVSRQISSVSNPAIMQQGRSSIHNVNSTTSSTLLHQNETELLVKEIAMLNFNKMWNETASKVKPGESLRCYQSGSSSSLSLVPHSSNVSGSVTSVSHQTMRPSDENALTSASAGFSSLSSVSSNSASAGGVTSTVMQGTRTSGMSAETYLPPGGSSLGSSESHKYGISPGKQVHSRPTQFTFIAYRERNVLRTI